MQTARTRLSRQGWVTLALLMAVVTAGVPQATSIAPFLNELAGNLGVSVGRAGQLGTANFVGAFLACVLLVPFIERIPMRVVLGWSALAVGITTVLTALISDFLMVFAFRVVAGAAQGLIMAGTLAAVGRAWSDPGTRTRLTGFVVGAIGGGGGAVTPLLRLIAEASDWHVAFYAYGGLSLFVAGLVFLLIPTLPGVAAARSPGLAARLKEASVAASMPGVDRTLLLAGVVWLVWIAIPVFCAGFLVAIYPGQDAWIGPMFLIGSAGFVAASFSSGPVIVRLGGPRRAPAFIGVLFPAAVVGYMWLTPSPVVTVLAATLACFAFGLYVPVLVALMREYGRERQGAAMFTYGAVQQAGAAAGTAIWGVIVEASGFGGLQLAVTCGLVLPVATLVGSIAQIQKQGPTPKPSVGP